MKHEVETMIVPYKDFAIRHHLQNNVANLSNPNSIEIIVEACEQINAGNIELTENSPFGCSWGECLEDLQLLN